MTDLKSMTLEEITAALRAMGEPSFRGKQVFTWLHRGITDFDEMMNIPKSLREKLRAEYYITVPTVARKQVSKLDGTIKYLWELQDGNCIETVLMSYHHGNTVCISSQVGCRMGCKFCASTLAGKVRDLTPSEMLDQVLFTQLDHRHAAHLAFHLRRGAGHRRARGGQFAAHAVCFAPRARQRDAQPHHAREQRLRRGGAVRRLPPLL